MTVAGRSGRVPTLRTAAEFKRVYRTGRTFRGRGFTLRVARSFAAGSGAAPGTGSPAAAPAPSVFGFVVSTKVAKSAVVRNRIRRRAREFVRRAVADGLAPDRAVAVIANAAAPELTAAATTAELSDLFKQATLIR